MLSSLGLSEPLAAAMTSLLSANLPAVITAMNATVTDGYTIDEPVQYLPYVPVPSLLQGGMPVIGFHRLGGQFQDDLQTNMDARHEYAVVAIIENADHETLVHQLERTLECVAYTIQQDRLAGTPTGTASVLKTAGKAWSVRFERYEPGPLLGDLDPNSPEAPPRTYLSYAGLVMSSERTEV